MMLKASKPVKRALLVGSALGVVVLLSSCAADAEAPASGASQSAPSHGASRPASVNDVDTHFLAMMTPHHAQAVEMSDIVLAAEGVTPDTRDIAERIRAGQQTEIDTMMEWVAEWGLAWMLEQHSGHIANGMVLPEEMAVLATLGGSEAEQTFLEEMIAHHEGAIAMTQNQIDNGGYTPLVTLAQQMIDVQTAEVLEMKTLRSS